MFNPTQNPLAHHKPSEPIASSSSSKEDNTILERLTYGVPAPRRMLTPSLLLKKHDVIRGYLVALGLTAAEREITLHLLRLYAYYGRVYPKAHEFAEDGGCSKRSFWRAVAKLESQGVLDRINRYLHHRQISNCYRLDKLVLCLARYLAEHACPYLDQFTHDCLAKLGSHFWRAIHLTRVRLRDPIPITLEA